MNFLRKIKGRFDPKFRDIDGQVVTKKIPWLNIFISLLVTGIVIFIFYKVRPNWTGAHAFSSSLKNFFIFKPISQGLASWTVEDTLMISFELLLQTIIFSVVGTFMGIVLSIPLAMLSSKNISKSPFIYFPSRIVMSILRAVPPLIFAYLLYNVVSPTLAATLTIGIFVSTIMTKWLYEDLDTYDVSSYDGLQSFGNTKITAFKKAIFPYLMRRIAVYGFYVFEIVIRFAAILGVVGIATIGQLLNDNFKTIDKWGHMSIVLWILIAFIVILEVLSWLFKKYILNYHPKQIEFDSSMTLEQKNQLLKKRKPKIWIAKLCIAITIGTLLIYSLSQIEWETVNDIKMKFFKLGMRKLFAPDWRYITKFGTGVNALQEGFIAVLVSGAGVIIGLIFSTIFGVLASKNIMGKWASIPFKVLIIIVRAIPVFVYAMLFMLLSPENKLVFAGALALGIHSIGMLGKLTYEAIDKIDKEILDSIDSMGATRWQKMRYGILKEIMPTILSNALYRWEINFKSTVVIGAVGASVFGLQIGIMSSNPNNFDVLTPYLLVTIGFVLILEQVSNLGRKKLMKGYFISEDAWIKQWIKNTRRINALAYSNILNLQFKNTSEYIDYSLAYSKYELNRSSNDNRDKIKTDFKTSKLNIKNEIKIMKEKRHSEIKEEIKTREENLRNSKQTLKEKIQWYFIKKQMFKNIKSNTFSYYFNSQAK